LRAAAAGGARRASPAAKRACYTGIVKNQQGSATELLQIKAREKHELLNFQHSRDKASSESAERAARLAAAPPPGALRALIRLRRIAKRAFFHGIVKNQQRSATEPWQIKARERHALLNFEQSRDKLCLFEFCTSEFPTLP
jgi:hypothetical protein